MSAVAYQLEAVTRRYGERTVLRIDRQEVRRGEVLGLVGPTGAGKSTLLRLLAALEPPSSGQIHFGGVACFRGPIPASRNEPESYRAAKAWHASSGTIPVEVLRRITLVFQRPLLLSGSVRANVEYPLRLRGLPRHSEKARNVLDALRLHDLAARSAQTLSGGETQLVALARALVLEPEVLLLDEPTSNLDPARVALVENVIGDYQRRTGATLVWATHNHFQARRVAQQVALLLDGRLVETATTKEFFEAPRDPRTAAFVRGEMVY